VRRDQDGDAGQGEADDSLSPVSVPALPSFDLVVATLGREREVARFLGSVERQGYGRVRVILVDQNDDDRVQRAVAGSGVDVLVRRSERGLSRARNAGLDAVEADVVGFPDDDCEYPAGLLGRVAEQLGELDGISGRTADSSGRSVGRWAATPGPIDREGVWHRVNSAALFLRGALVREVGGFDERLGLPGSSGEEIDYVLRALAAGARIGYDPELVVLHDQPAQRASIGRRDGASIGYLLRKHGFPARTVARMLVRPLGGMAVSAARRDLAQARFHAATLAGRLQGYRGASRSKSSA
jgi:GT2 family glycosyltransferase